MKHNLPVQQSPRELNTSFFAPAFKGIFALLLSASLSVSLSTSSEAQNALSIAISTSGTPTKEQSRFIEGVNLFKATKGGPSFGIANTPPTADNIGSSTALVSWNTPEVDPLSPALLEKKIVGIIANSVTKRVMYLGSYVFGFGYSEELTYKNYASVAGKKLSANRICVTRSNTPLQEIRTNSFIEQSKSLGNTIVFNELLSPSDAGTLLSKATNEKCDIFFSALEESDVDAFLTAAKGSNYKGKILLGDLDPFAHPLVKEVSTQVYGVSTLVTNEEFLALATKSLGRTLTAKELGDIALGYDLMTCVAATQGELSADTLKYSFLASPCEGLTGVTKFSGQRISQRAKKVVNMTGGSPVLVEL